LTIRQLRTDFSRRHWRSFEVKNLTLEVATPLNISAWGDLESLEMSAGEKVINFDLDLLQREAGELASRKISGLQTSPGKKILIVPKNWKKLGATEIEKRELLKESIRF